MHIIRNFDSNLMETTFHEIQIPVMKDISIDDEAPVNYGVVDHKSSKGVLDPVFTISMPGNKAIHRKMDHFMRFRDVLVKKWPAFVPLPQVSLQIIGKTNVSNEIKQDILNSFIKDIV